MPDLEKEISIFFSPPLGLGKKITELDYLLTGLKKKYDFIYDISVSRKKDKERLFLRYPEYSMIYYSVMQSLIVDFNKVFNRNEKHSIHKIINEYKDHKCVKENSTEIATYLDSIKEYRESIQTLINVRNKISAHLDDQNYDEFRFLYNEIEDLIIMTFNVLNYIYRDYEDVENININPPKNDGKGEITKILLDKLEN